MQDDGERDLMAWGRLDDTMAFHRKIMKAGNAGVGAWARMIAWSCGEGTDGFIPAETARAIATPEELQRLLFAGLLEPGQDDGYTIHDFLDYNRSAAQLAADRAAVSAARAEAGRRGAAARWQRDSKPDGKTDSKIDGPSPSPDPSTENEDTTRDPLEAVSDVPALGDRRDGVAIMNMWNDLGPRRLMHDATTAKVLGDAIVEALRVERRYGRKVPELREVLRGLQRIGERMVRGGLQNVWQAKTLVKSIGDAILVARGELDPDAGTAPRAAARRGIVPVLQLDLGNKPGGDE